MQGFWCRSNPAHQHEYGVYMPENVKSSFCEAKRKPVWSGDVPWYKRGKIFVPINIQDHFHWIAAVIDLERMTITCYDSLNVSLSHLLLTQLCFPLDICSCYKCHCCCCHDNHCCLLALLLLMPNLLLTCFSCCCCCNCFYCSYWACFIAIVEVGLYRRTTWTECASLHNGWRISLVLSLEPQIGRLQIFLSSEWLICNSIQCTAAQAITTM